MDQYDAGDWRGLVDDYEKDVVVGQTLHRDDTRLQSDKDEARIRKAAELLSLFQCSKARKHLQYNGLGGHLDESNIVEQIT